MINQNYQLPVGTNFSHPLADTTETKEHGLLLNTWMMGVFIINTLIDPSGTEDGGMKAEDFAKTVALKGNPTLNIESTIKRVKQRYLIDCQMLCNAIANGMQSAMDEQLEK